MYDHMEPNGNPQVIILDLESPSEETEYWGFLVRGQDAASNRKRERVIKEGDIGEIAVKVVGASRSTMWDGPYEFECADGVFRRPDTVGAAVAHFPGSSEVNESSAKVGIEQLVVGLSYKARFNGYTNRGHPKVMILGPGFDSFDESPYHGSLTISIYFDSRKRESSNTFRSQLISGEYDPNEEFTVEIVALPGRKSPEGPYGVLYVEHDASELTEKPPLEMGNFYWANIDIAEKSGSHPRVIIYGPGERNSASYPALVVPSTNRGIGQSSNAIRQSMRDERDPEKRYRILVVGLPRSEDQRGLYQVVAATSRS